MAVTDDGVAHVSAGCLELQVVKIDECTDLTDAAVAFFTNFDLTNGSKRYGRQASMQAFKSRGFIIGRVEQVPYKGEIKPLYVTCSTRIKPD